MSPRKSQRLASAAAAVTIEPVAEKPWWKPAGEIMVTPPERGLSSDHLAPDACWKCPESLLSPHQRPTAPASWYPADQRPTFFSPAYQNCYQPSSADTLHAPRPPAAGTLKIAQADGFGASLPASTPQHPSPLPPACATAEELHLGQDTTAATIASAKPSWNALRRYYSEASSFPDYGSPYPAMGVDRLRQMNQSCGPVNTLTKSSNKREFSDSIPATHQALTKRQRRENSLKETISPEPVDEKSPPSSRPTPNNPQHAGNTSLAPAPKLKQDAYTDMNDSNPAPSNVTSDVASRRGRPRWQSPSASSPAFSGRTTKRVTAPLEHDEIETSEDELQSSHPTTASAIRQTKFSQIKTSPRSRPRMRGDITPSRFADHVPRQTTKPHMAILKAVSGERMYDATQEGQPSLSLHQCPSKPSYLEAWSDGQPDQGYQWVSFDINDVSKIRYGGCYLYFRRSMIRGRPPQILLRFASREGASQVAKLIGNNIVETHTREEMEKMLRVSWDKAIQRSEQLARHADMQPVYKSSDGNKDRKEIEEYPKSLEWNSKKLREKTTVRSDHQEPRRSASPIRRVGMQTRRTRNLSPTRRERSPILDRWSEKNAGWEDSWKQTLVYPATGRNRASVDKEDILRLDEGEFLNDNLISFYLRYLQTKMERERPELLNRVHIFSTFFFEKLTSGKGSINYDGVKSWTSKLDLLSHDYIVVPVNENAHWYLAVICNAPKLLEPVDDDQTHNPVATDALGRLRPETPIMTTVEREMSDISLEELVGTRRSSRQHSSGIASSPPKAAAVGSSPARTAQVPRAPSKRLDASQPRIVTLDSLGSNHSATCKALKEYLVEEAKDKKNVVLTSVPGGMKARGIPEQNNFCDCGVFVLGYMEEFLKDPDVLVRKILLRENIDWSIDAARLRKKVRQILFQLQNEQTERMAKELEQRRHQKRPSRSSTSSISATIKDASPKCVVKNKRVEASASLLPQPPQPLTSPTLRGSVTPTAAASPTSGRAAEASADQEDVDTVKLPSEVAYETGAKSPAEPSPLVSLKPQSVQVTMDALPTSSAAGDSHIDDTQESVQLLSIIDKSQTPQTSQAKGP
ncbi:hypothetical protein NLG97_g812 [Lecanicillium saksenae]|uniref:Uncharacterized protein n=1 Tax=Lecanicillium saksenae TaxID=468837 RepID=A0ACC1R5H7_9HYPO|nr:hypothetical protein NLG97_g812 [Lecanicillium saksenae]